MRCQAKTCDRLRELYVYMAETADFYGHTVKFDDIEIDALVQAVIDWEGEHL